MKTNQYFSLVLPVLSAIEGSEVEGFFFTSSSGEFFGA